MFELRGKELTLRVFSKSDFLQMIHFISIGKTFVTEKIL